ncbi:low affinity potassium transporter [Scheffersomyces stipitis CBS 6054]|uniref:Potassium transport protein n=1 Tax=Scheffersomyces stipitis (strain ATCC 58785 / CBS 6054 / NBRC 10063 / NRRL Y-11545) TaxID=322104 RepID=A3LXW3_PICST|nr:low affinity potassium transporter [Scheffersomyces stipitis CBS 6054]ABN67532.2 low affinity potassium transporter [Scheffersomyces stipitis CBS 6054]
MLDTIKKYYATYRRKRLESEVGLRVRNQIHRLSSVLGPTVKVLVPNFRAAHYCYIIFWVFFGSVLVYPVRNLRYIDALFFTGGASTQAGLNTVDTNTIALYQQIILYIIATFTTPIFIHGSMLFVRLYFFERHFDNIKEKSKLNFKMRRQATIAARTQSMDATRLNTFTNQNLGFDKSKRNNNRGDNVDKEQKDNGLHTVDVEMANNSSPQSSSTFHGDVEHIDEPSDSDEERGRRAPDDIRLNDLNPDSPHDAVRFGNLPQPSKRARSKELDPSDMYRSIALLQDSHNNSTRNLDDDDEVLVIKSPNEIEKTGGRIYTKRKPKSHRPSGSSGSKPWKKGSKWSNRLRKTFSNSGSSSTPKTKRSYSTASEEIVDDDASIDSENEVVTTDVADDDDENDHDYNHNDNNDDDDDDEEAVDDEDSVNDGDVEDDANPESPRKEGPTTHFAEPANDPRRKRPNLLDVPNGSRKHSFVSSPTYEKFEKFKKNIKKGKLKRIKTPGVSQTSSRLFGYNSSINVDDDSYVDEDAYDEDDEEASYEENEIGPTITKVMSTNYLSWEPTVGRNSTFIHMTEAQKEELGGVEYRAVKLLIKILVLYYIGFHVLAVVLLLPWILMRESYIEVVRTQGVSPTWWAFFTASSAFNDLGFTLTADSMVSFGRSVYVMIVVSFFIVIGNTGFPVFLRFIIWILFKTAKPLSLYKESLGFLLDHPRRCFTLLFPSVPTWWLFIILVVLNGVDLVLFIILDLNNNYLKEIPVGYRIVDGLFQAFSTRTAGFAVVDLSQLHPAVQVSYMIMMYISVLPLAISIRRTNVYEEQSLGVYLKEENHEDDEKTPHTFIGAHLRNQLSFDLWFIFLGLFIMCIAEGGKLNNNDIRFTVFSILFEIISAYGTVGLSLGYTGVNASLSSQFSVISKLVIVAMMVRGRHRGLPYTLDRAIMLPDADMQRRDHLQENHAIRRHTTMERENTLGIGGDNILRRVITREGGILFGRRRSSAFAMPSLSENPSYIITSTSQEEQELEAIRNQV